MTPPPGDLHHTRWSTLDDVTRREVLRASLTTALTLGAVTACDAPHDAAPPALRTHPAPFTGSPPRVVVVRWDGSTPAARAWWRGANAQAAAANLRVHVIDAGRSSPGQQTALEHAAADEPDGVIVDGGSAGTLLPGLRGLTRQGIPVVIHDVTPSSLLAQAPQAVIVRADDPALAQVVLAAMSATVRPGSTVGLVGPLPGYADLDRRRAVWTQVRTAHQWNQVLISDAVAQQLQVAAATDPRVAARNADILSGALTGRSDLRAVFALDELLGAATATALNRARVPASLYSVGGTALAPAALTAPSSPWAATALTDPAYVGAAAVRALALRLAGDLDAHTPGITRAGRDQLVLDVPGQLLTQADLRARSVATGDQLWTTLPTPTGAAQPSVATAPWLPAMP